MTSFGRVSRAIAEVRSIARLLTDREPVASPAPHLPVNLGSMLREIEDRYIDAALARSGTKAEAAKMLGMERTTLVEKLRRRRRRSA